MNTRVLNFSKINEVWYYMAGNERPTSQHMMPVSTIAILEFASKGADQATLRLLRKNTLEKVKISLGRERYMKGGALYYVLD